LAHAIYKSCIGIYVYIGRVGRCRKEGRGGEQGKRKAGRVREVNQRGKGEEGWRVRTGGSGRRHGRGTKVLDEV